jgi:phosphoribosylformylglycinamidine synthase
VTVRARVLVKPKAGILDPQGQAVERTLPALGFTGVRNVHVGRLIELDVDDPAQLPAMCERLLCNPLIEDYVVESVDSAGVAELAASGSTIGSSARADSQHVASVGAELPRVAQQSRGTDDAP